MDFKNLTRCLCWALFILILFPLHAGAQELGSTGAQYTEVVDAFDIGDPYDFHLSVMYEHTRKKAEVSMPQA